MIFTQGKKFFFQLTCPLGQVQGLFYFSRSPAYLYMYLSEKTLNKKLLGMKWVSLENQWPHKRIFILLPVSGTYLYGRQAM